MDDFNLAVCPHDTIRNSEGWFRLVQYLSQRLSAKLHFHISLDFTEFHSTYTTADLVFANPSDALKLIDQHGYIALMRPSDSYDEALVVAGQDSPEVSLNALNGAALATVEGMLPTKLALRMLKSKGVVPGSMASCDSWLNVVRSVWNGEVPYGVLYRDAYDELSPQGKAMVQVIGATDERAAFHILCCGPKTRARCDELAAVLRDMADDGLGREVLSDLHFGGWQSVSAAELEAMRGLLV